MDPKYETLIVNFKYQKVSVLPNVVIRSKYAPIEDSVRQIDFEYCKNVCLKYEIELKDLLGSGCFGDVYVGLISTANRNALRGRPSARIKSMDKRVEVAVKIPRLGVSQEMIKNEVEAMKKVSGIYLCEIKEINAIVMDRVKGGTLEDLLKREELTPDKIVSIALQIADSMESVHRKDVVHRDLRCCNVLISKSGGVFVSDFGVSTTHNQNEYSCVRYFGQSIYTQAGQSDNIKAFDVLLFGILLWKMVTGKTPEDLDINLVSWKDARMKKLIGMCIEKDEEKRCHFSEIKAVLRLFEANLKSETLQSTVSAIPIKKDSLQSLLKMYHKHNKCVKVLLQYFQLDREYTPWLIELFRSILRDPSQYRYHSEIINLLVSRQLHNYPEYQVLESFLFPKSETKQKKSTTCGLFSWWG